MSLPFTHAELLDAVAEGHVTMRHHPSLPLCIYNYSPEVQHTNYWNDITLMCRGLILDHAGNIVARPWKKFFNLGQVDLPIQFDTPVEVMDKVDGSLGILYPTPDGFAVATRGSFDSGQARHATQLWKDEYAMYHDFHIGTGFMDDYTFLFEIIYPSNRIVLNYGDMDDLMLLGAVQKSTGYYIGPREAQAILGWIGPVVEVMPYNSISEALRYTDRPNAEGFVIRSHNFMVKLKQPDYLELHKLVTNASPKTVWEQLKAGKSKSEIVSAFPDEFHDYIGGMIDPLIYEFNTRLTEIQSAFSVATSNVAKSKTNAVDASVSRRDYAFEFKKWKDAKYFFLMLDNRPIRDVLWAELKPKESALERIENADVR